MDYHISSPWDVGNLEEFLYFCCPECDERSQSKELFLQHAINLHPTSTEFLNRFETKEEDVFDLKKEECPDEKDFIKDSDIKVEMIKSEENYEESWSVDQNTMMDSAYENNDTYKPKLKKVKKSDDKQVPCDICSKLYKNHTSMYSHKSRAHGDHKRIACHLCDKTFLKQSALEDHLASAHGKSKKHHCDLCSKDFATSKMFYQHQKKVHEEKPIQCQLCGQFLRKGYMKKHIKTVHEKIKDAQCDLCNKTFCDAQYLQTHIKYKYYNKLSKRF